jgi:hypothetical protein
LIFGRLVKGNFSLNYPYHTTGGLRNYAAGGMDCTPFMAYISNFLALLKDILLAITAKIV